MRKSLYFFALVMLLLSAFNSYSQANIFNPADPDVIFTPTTQPATPPYSNNMLKWGHSSRLSWNPYTVGYKSYYFQGMAFRLKFPKTYQHNVVDGKKYPLYIFFHGLGEKGDIFDNEYQLAHGGQLHAQNVDNGNFDGFLFYAQSASGNSQDYEARISNLIDSLTKYVKVDLDRVIVSGLSAGGASTWDILSNDIYNKKICAAIPISAASLVFTSYFPKYITVPIWISNGGQDASPAPYTVNQVIASYKQLGGKIDQTFFPNLGHGVWDYFWATPGYFQYLAAQHKANPLVYFQRNQFCPTDTISAKLGVHPGFYAYQWDKDGIVIPSATTNTITVTQYGAYRARFKRTATAAWSVWSPSPAVISQKQATITPPIQTNGNFSTVLPSVDGRTTTPLVVPNTYAAYEWRRITDSALVSSTNTYNAPVGQYKVMVTEQYGCSSSFSAPFVVIAANGPNPPDNITNFSGVALNSASIRLDWNDNPAPAYNETAFEIFRSTTAGSGFALIGKTNADIVNYTDSLLLANTTYYYIVRPINLTGAASASIAVTVTTKKDIIAPTTPNNLIVTGTTRTSISLSWDPSTDDVGVYKYDIYIDGAKAYITSNTTITLSNLTSFQTFGVYVIARDLTGNQSPKSNQVSATTALNGLNYKYYQGSWSVLPDFNALTPVKTGLSANVDISVSPTNTQWGILWEGIIKIPVSGSYTFETSSDDGSKLYIGSYSNSATALVNNDGLHGTQSATGTITLNAGTYPIAITFFQQGGGQAMNVYWQSTAAGITRQLIPNTAFGDSIAIATSSLPVKPSNLNVISTTYNSSSLTWNANSTNDVGFEVSRSTSLLGAYVVIGTTVPNATSFVDSLALSPATKYWYKIRAINKYGQSGYVSTLDGQWGFNNDFNDGSGNNRNLTGTGTPTFSTDKKEGALSVSLNGSNQYLNLPFAINGVLPANSYDSRSVALWIKPTTSMTDLASTNKVIYDFGGADNGMSLKFDKGLLLAGIASNNVRANITTTSIVSNVNWVTSGWNHICVVYNVNQLQLFLNAKLIGTAALSFNSVGVTTNGSRIGGTNGTNAFNSASANYGGLIDDIVILREPVSATGIAAIMNQSYTSDTTLALPAIPAAPTNLAPTSTTPGSISLSFNDNSTTETSFQVFRSVANANNFRILQTITGGDGATKSFIDSNLFANSNYYYKVRAVGVGGLSDFTGNLLVSTANNIPIFTSVDNFTMRYDSQKGVPISATDLDAGPLTLSFVNPLPSFAIFTNTTNGKGTLSFSPAIADQGVYNILVQVADGNQGTNTLAFTVTVNDSYLPVITPLSDTAVAEGSSTNINLSATKQGGNSSLAWSITSAPAFVTLVDNGSGQANLTIAPNYANAGFYPIKLLCSDGAGGNVYSTFKLTVVNVVPVSPEKVYISTKSTSTNAPAPWNNVSTTSTSNLLNATGNPSAIGIDFIATPWNGGNAGAVTGNNSGVYPDAVIQDYFWFGAYGAPQTVNVNLRGLSTTAKYNVTVFGSSAWTGLGNNGTTNYTINGIVKPLYVDNNQQNTVTFSSVSPDTTGIIQLNLSKGTGAPYGMVNAIVLEKLFDDGTTPVLPGNFAAQPLSDGTVKLSWLDIAYNENRYLVYRATNAAGPFTVLNPNATNANDTTFIDGAVLSGNTYYYQIEATNSYGSSGLTGVVNAVTTNKAPVLTSIADLVVKAGATSNVNVVSTDGPGEAITVTVTGLPSFASFVSTGNGTGTITISPAATTEQGIFKNITVKSTDALGATSTVTFNITVTEVNLRTVFVNFGVPGGTTQPAPWNNFNFYPSANSTLSSLKDDANTNAGFSITLQQAWQSNWIVGMMTGFNTGIFPDNVLQSSIVSPSTTALGLQISGLNPGNKYNVAFLSSINAGKSQKVTFTSGTQSVVQEARYNTNVSVQLNGLTPSASGTLVVTALKDSSAAYLNLNAMVIQEYIPGTPLIKPYYLFAESILDSNKVKLTWSDRSDNESGFQIYRSASLQGTYSLITTTAANVTNFIDSGLTSNTRYYYQVNAINANETSGYSNIASLVMPYKIVFVDLNSNASQISGPQWNNTLNQITAGSLFPNLKDNTLTPSGMDMTITKDFNAPGYAGVTTQGVFPGVVMSSNYWTDAGMVSEVKFSNLDIRKKYKIGCFGSAIHSSFSIGVYTCNGKAVQLNSLYNDSKIAYLKDLTSADGDLVVTVTTLLGQPYSFTSAFTIESYDDPTPYTSTLINSLPNTTAGARIYVSNNMLPFYVDKPAGLLNSLLSPEEVDKPGVSVYPNPFTNKIEVSLSNKKEAAVTVLLYDLSANLVYKTAEFKQPAGKSTITVNIPTAATLARGVYVVNIIVDGKMTKSVRLIKVQ